MAANPTNMSLEDFKAYLSKNGITDFKQSGDEVSFSCPFNGCDDDHRDNEEFHCGFNLSNCTYNCFKCGEKGNFITLMKHFGDYDEFCETQKANKSSARADTKLSLKTRALKAFNSTHGSTMVRDYFHGRGINDDSITKHMLGSWKYNGQDRLMIPIFDATGEVVYLKLRRTPSADVVAKEMGKEDSNPKYIVYPTGASLILVGEDQLAKSSSSDVLICEGELDRIIAIQEGVKMPVVTGGGGAQTFKNEWIDSLNNGERNMRNIYICMDKDEAGKNGSIKLAERITKRMPEASIYVISLPFEDNTHADLTDYFVQKKGTADELFTKYASFYCGAKPIDASQFKEMTVLDIENILDATIKYDNITKCIIFLAMLSTYTESDQLNIMINGDSSSGKSYNVTEVSKLFPKQDVLFYGKTTPTAFYYSSKLKRVDEETGQTYMDLERRIMIFVEQPDAKLQENLRALLSHDEKKIPFAITNKGKRGENAAIEGYIKGYPSTFFCSANMLVDEQEQTRCLIISPETSHLKVFASLNNCLTKSSNKSAYDAKIRSNKLRNQLIERILYIKGLNIDTIDIGDKDSDYLMAEFLKTHTKLRAKDQRGFSHFISLVKAMALLNAPFRMANGKVVATKTDIDEALKLWFPLCESEIYGISPQVYDFYKRYVLGAYKKKKSEQSSARGVTIKEIIKEYYSQSGSYPNTECIRKQYIPALEIASLISCEYDKSGDSREKLIIPNIFPGDKLEDNT